MGHYCFAPSIECDLSAFDCGLETRADCLTIAVGWSSPWPS